jgi:hypothetical protein
MADLVSGNLKEEKGAHSVERVHLGGPSASTRNLLNRYGTKPISHSIGGVPSSTFDGKQAQTKQGRSRNMRKRCEERLQSINTAESSKDSGSQPLFPGSCGDAMCSWFRSGPTLQMT